MPDRERLLAYPDPPLTDGVVVLRQWARDDLTCVEEAAEDPYIPRVTTVPSTFTTEAGLAWIERQWSRADDGTGLSQAIADPVSSDALGAAVLVSRQRGTAAIGYWLIPRARGRGLGSRAVALLATWAAADGPFDRVEALVEPENVASQRVLEKSGFRREGLLRSYLVFDDRRADAWIFSLLRSDLRSEPTP